MRKKKMTSFDQFATAICENIARNLGLPKIEVLLRRQKHADARKRSATMKRIIATALAVVVCGPALGADMHWCEKANGVGGNYPICPAGYAQKDGEKYVAPVAVEPLTVHLGMADSVAEASDYPWGRPISRNRTTNSSGVHEQWVYSGRRYLYFTNGVLTSISD